MRVLSATSVMSLHLQDLHSLQLQSLNLSAPGLMDLMSILSTALSQHSAWQEPTDYTWEKVIYYCEWQV